MKYITVSYRTFIEVMDTKLASNTRLIVKTKVFILRKTNITKLIAAKQQL